MSSVIQTDTTQLVLIPDHPDLARAALLSQYRDKPRIRAFVEALGEGAQIAEEETFDLLIGSTFDLATGDALDQWGDLVGERRGALGDEDYRRFIRARIRANYSESTTDELITIFGLILYPAQIAHRELYPAAFTLYAFTEMPLSEMMRRRVRRFMAGVKPAGIAMELVEVYTGYFGFEHDPIAEAFEVGVWARDI